MNLAILTRRPRPEWVLPLAILLAFLLSSIGITWGRYEDWHFDQMAFLPIRGDGFPVHYLKPPLHTYLTRFLVTLPMQGLASALPLLSGHLPRIITLCGHLLTILLYCGTIILAHVCVRRTCGLKAAAFVSLTLATSAGLIQFNHYGTADSPLLFWMMASFAMAMRYSVTGAFTDSLAAGLLAGLAAADKYNGLGVAIAITAAAFLRNGWRGPFLPPSLLGAAAVPVGFFLGNPGAFLDHERFVRQFLYNTLTTPVYYGDIHRSGYWDFLASFPQLIGLPASLVLLLLTCSTVILAFRKQLDRAEVRLFCLSGAVFLFYFATIGRFPRMESRFVMPAIPFVLMLAGPAVRRLAVTPLTAGVIAVLLLYNLVSTLWLSSLFLRDPRMESQSFARLQFPMGASVESTYSPDWNLLPGVSVRIRRVTCDSGADNRFTSIFGKGNAIIANGLKECAAHDPSEFFSENELSRRHPDFITFSSVTYVIAADERTRAFYRDLEEGKLGYDKVFDRSLPRMPKWLYPQFSDALMDRMVILQRKRPMITPSIPCIPDDTERIPQ